MTKDYRESDRQKEGRNRQHVRRCEGTMKELGPCYPANERRTVETDGAIEQKQRLVDPREVPMQAGQADEPACNAAERD